MLTRSLRSNLDWQIQDLEIEHKYWQDLTDEEKEAAMFFGYCQPTWDGSQETDGLPDWTNFKASSPSKKHGEEKKEDSDDEKKKKKPVFKMSKTFGGDGGQPFNLGRHKRISKIVVHADRHCVHGLEITTGNGEEKKMGTADGDKHEFTLNNHEFIVGATIRANKLIQCLAFKTNKGRELGPAGGKGWLIGRDSCGDEEEVKAPFKLQLCGFSGKGGKNLDQLTLHWGPVPSKD